MFDPELKLAAEGQPRFDYSQPAAARSRVARMGATLAAKRYWKDLEESVSFEDLTIPNDVSGSPTPIRIYRPHNAAKPGGAVVFFHGGGFMVGDLNVEHYRCLKWAQDTRTMVVSCDYRLSPENRYPAALEDCAGCFHWVATNATELGIDPSRIVIAGVSAGGNLAASVSLFNRDRGLRPACLQMLIYPALDDRMTSLSMNTHTDQPGWTRVDTKHMWAHYLGADWGEVPPYAAPARAGDLSGLPPAYIMVAQFDPLRDEATDYALRLTAAGLCVDFRSFAGTFHGFDVVKESRLAQYALDDQIFAINRAIQTPARVEPIDALVAATATQ
jgi:acetyl esterase/lipase